MHDARLQLRLVHAFLGGQQLHSQRRQHRLRLIGTCVGSVDCGLGLPNALGGHPGRFIERQADRGAAAAPELARIIAQSYERKREADRAGAPGGTEDATAARTALCLIGPDAASVLPALEALMADGTVPESALGADGWQYTLARLGKPVADIARPAHSRMTQGEFERRTEAALRDLGAIKCRR